MEVGIVGYGHVGKAMKDLFKGTVIYDEPLNIGSKAEINSCDLVFVCVPTPEKEDDSFDRMIIVE